MAEQRYIDGIRAALHDEMARDSTVIVLGEDVSTGGPFGATAGLADEFGHARVRDTPISEGALMGAATGAATVGLRPVLEVMFVDFITLGMDQLVNHAAKLHYMSNGQLRVPLTIRVQGGSTGGFGPHHSQSLEAWFLHVPGLKVVAPFTPADAKTLLVAAMRDDNPVLFLEHRGLYWSRGDVPKQQTASPLSAVIRRPGRDVTVVAASRMVATVLGAADSLAHDGVEAEVIDLRSLLPLDLDTILTSVRRTGRLLVTHEAVLSAGPGAEIAARLHELAFDSLVAPVARVGAPFAPVPFSACLEEAFVPSEESIVKALNCLMEKSTQVKG